MTYALVSPAQIASLEFWRHLSRLDWVVCTSDVVDLDDDVSLAVLRWLERHLEHPLAGLTIGHLHLFVETFSRALSRPLSIVGPRFMTGKAAQDPAHTRIALDASEEDPSHFVVFLSLSVDVQRATLFGVHTQAPSVSDDVPQEPSDTPQEAPHVARVHHRPDRVRRSPKGSTALARQGQSLDPRPDPDDSTEPTAPAGSGGD